MNINYIVMAHTNRKAYVPPLLDQLPKDTQVSWDNGDLGLVKAHIQAWELYGGDYTCVIQDDAILTDNFLEKAQYHVNQCVQNYGRIALHFYLRKSPKFSKKVKKWKQEGRDHVVMKNLHAGLAICLPSEIIPDMLDYFKSEHLKSGDKRINKYLRKEEIPVYFPLPSLVEHRNLPSLHSGNSSPVENRVAQWFES